jgi:predicted NACHT family NTPase
LLIERAQTLWSFSHLTFQEYFVAQWFVQSQNWRELAQQVLHPRWQEVFLVVVEISQPADNVLWAIKREIDLSVATDQKVQSVLTWAEEKSASTTLPCKPAAIRAFYSRLPLDLAKVRDCALDTARARDIIHEIAHALVLDRPLALIRARARARALDLEQDLACDLNLDLALDFALVLTIDLALVRIQDFACDRILSFTFTQTIGHDGDIALAHTLTLAVALALTPQLEQRLQFLKSKLPNFSGSNRVVIEQWWRNNGQDWIKRLRQLMMEHRNIGHDWQLTQLQEQTLQQHYGANVFLIKLLKQSGVTAKKTHQEIENNLLLPISALQRLQPDLY